MTVVTIVVSIACFIVGGFASYMFFKHGLKSKYDKEQVAGSKGKIPEQESRFGERSIAP